MYARVSAAFPRRSGAGSRSPSPRRRWEQLEYEVVAEAGERGVVAGAFVAEEGVLAVELVPVKRVVGFGEGV